VTGLSPDGASTVARVDLVVIAESVAAAPLVEEFFVDVERRVLPPGDLRVTTPWEGPLFALLGGLGGPGADDGDEAVGRRAKASRPALGLVLPVVWTAPDPPPEVVLIADHVNLTLRGPLCGRRPHDGPQTFPIMAGIYQPERLRTALAGRVYSEVAVAGVGDARRLTSFERQSLAECACPAVCDCLVDIVIIAAHHGLHVVGCGLPQPALHD
jgi:hypothetical protein